MALEIVRFYRRQGFTTNATRHRTRDCAHDAIADLFEKLAHAPSDPHAFHDWTISFALIEIQELRTKDKRLDRKLDALRQAPGPAVRGPETQLAWYRSLRRLRAEVEKLPTPYRQTFELVCEHESAKKVAAQLGVPAGTIRRRYSVARQWLLDAFEDSRLTAPEFRTPAPS